MKDRDDIDILHIRDARVGELFSSVVCRQIEEYCGVYIFMDSHPSSARTLFCCGVYRGARQKALDALHHLIVTQLGQRGLVGTSWADFPSKAPAAGRACRVKAPLEPTRKTLTTAERDLLLSSSELTQNACAASVKNPLSSEKLCDLLLKISTAEGMSGTFGKTNVVQGMAGQLLPTALLNPPAPEEKKGKGDKAKEDPKDKNFRPEIYGNLAYANPNHGATIGKGKGKGEKNNTDEGGIGSYDRYGFNPFGPQNKFGPDNPAPNTSGLSYKNPNTTCNVNAEDLEQAAKDAKSNTVLPPGLAALFANLNKETGGKTHDHDYNRGDQSSDDDDHGRQDDDDGGDGGRLDASEEWISPVADMTVYSQPGPEGEDPVLDVIEQTVGAVLKGGNAKSALEARKQRRGGGLKVKIIRKTERGVKSGSTTTSGSCLTSGGHIRLDGDQSAAGEAMKKLDAFVGSFEQLLIELPPVLTGSEQSMELLASVLAHYIRPVPWLCACYVEDGSVGTAMAAASKGKKAKDISKDDKESHLVLVGHQTSTKRAIMLLEEYISLDRPKVARRPILKIKGVKDNADEKKNIKGGGKREGSKEKRHKSPQEDVDVATRVCVPVTHKEASFVIGKGGKIRRKLAIISGGLELSMIDTVEKKGGVLGLSKTLNYSMADLAWGGG